MQQELEQIQGLIKKVDDGTATEEEMAIVEQYLKDVENIINALKDSVNETLGK